MDSGTTLGKTSCLLEFDRTSCSQLLKKGKIHFDEVVNESAKWSERHTMKGYRKITNQVKEQLDIWIHQHPNVRPTLITRDALLVKNKVTGEKELVGKLLLEIPVQELHNDMLLPVNKGGFAGAIILRRDATETLTKGAKTSNGDAQAVMRL
jgi:hypothetical protein